MGGSTRLALARHGWRVVATAVCLALAGAAGCQPTSPREVPVALLGRWETDAPRYAGRWLEVRQDELLWGMQDSILDRQRIERIELAMQQRTPEIRLHYREEPEGYDAMLRLRLDPGPPPRVRLGNGEERWRLVDTR